MHLPPVAHPDATHWAVERLTTDPQTGELLWRFVQVSRGPGGGPRRHWFPIAGYTDEAVHQLGAGSRVRVTFTPAPNARTKLAVVELDYTAPDPMTKPVVAPPTAQLATPAPTSTPSMQFAQAVAQATAAREREPAPKPLNGGPSDPGTLFERCHHLAHQDCAEVSDTTTKLASAMLGAVAQMAGIVMATAGQRVADWQQMTATIAQQSQQPNAQIQALGAAVQQLAAQNQQIIAHLAELESEPEEPPQLEPAEPTDGQRMVAALAPIAKELAPRIMDKLWPPDGPPLAITRLPPGDTEAGA